MCPQFFTTCCPCCTPFWYHACCQYTTLLNLPPPIFSLTPFGWLHSIILFYYFLWKYQFWFMPFWFMPTFSGTQLWHKTKTWCTCFIWNTSGSNNVDHMAYLHCNNFLYSMFSSFPQALFLIISVQVVLKGCFQPTLYAICKVGALQWTALAQEC
jgi:hypothetical protein